MSEQDALTKYLNSLIDERLEQWDTKIKEEDAKEIVDALMPVLEEKIAQIVLKHMKAIATFIQTELKEE
jgi:Ethanolamine utilization protein EutJ (predicted chaperonin)